MNIKLNALMIAVLGLSLAACAPPGKGALGYRDIDWPRADHLMTPSENREIEILLGRLGYKPGSADGQITTTTRNAIRGYQRDIGAPITGYVSTPLLNSLRVNAPAKVSQTTTPAPRRTTSTTPVRPRPAATPQTQAPTSGDSAGAGGSGSGAWN